MRNLRTLVTTLAVGFALTAGTAMAGDGDPSPYDEPSPITRPSPAAQKNHGLKIVATLNETITDGGEAAFSLKVTNHGAAIPFASISLLWSFNGRPAQTFAKISGLPSGTVFTDTKLIWVRIGALGRGKSFELKAMVHIAKRSAANGTNGASMFCIQGVVKSVYAGKPNAGWLEYGNMPCKLYSVSPR